MAGNDVNKAVKGKDKGPNEVYCTTCGEIISEQAEICPECGVRQQEAEPNVGGADTPNSTRCVECGQNVSIGVSRCPNCGFDPGSHKTWFWIHAFMTGVLWATLVGIPFSIITIWKGRKHRKKYKRGVTG